jgi:hypothetical protein
MAVAVAHMRGAAAGILVIAAAGGCANGRVSDEDTARGTVETFLAQCAAGRGPRVLETLNRSARATFLDARGGTRAGCAAVLAGRRVPPGARPRLARFDGTSAEFAVARARVTVSRGAEGWQIEGPW